jgi:enoyl-CoA hydratase
MQLASLVPHTVQDGIAVLRLSDPARRNVLSRRLSDDMALAVQASLSEGARALVVTAEGSVFCSGGDLDALLDGQSELADAYAGVLALSRSPVPTIAVVAGAAIGAGVSIALSCDVVLAAPEARFDPRFLDLAIHPGGAHLWRLAQRVGSQGASAMVLCGDVLTGEEAVGAGLAWRCLPAAEAVATAMKLAARAAARSPRLVRRTKQSLRASLAAVDEQAAFELEIEAQRWSVAQPEFAAAVQQVRAKLRGEAPTIAEIRSETPSTG